MPVFFVLRLFPYAHYVVTEKLSTGREKNVGRKTAFVRAIGVQNGAN